MHTSHACQNFNRFLLLLMQTNDCDENLLTCTDGVRVILDDDDGVLVEHLGVLLIVL